MESIFLNLVKIHIFNAFTSLIPFYFHQKNYNTLHYVRKFHFVLNFALRFNYFIALTFGIFNVISKVMKRMIINKKKISRQKFHLNK